MTLNNVLTKDFAFRLVHHIFNQSACIDEYDPSWSAEFCKREFISTFETVNMELGKLNEVFGRLIDIVKAEVPAFEIALFGLRELYNKAKDTDEVVLRHAIRDILRPLQNRMKDIEFTKLTKEKLSDYGFRIWSKKENNFLIPLYLKKCIDMEVTCINGSKVPLSKADNDIRYGCIAYGISIENFVA